MVKEAPKNQILLKKIKQIANSTKFRIIEKTQNREISITVVSKEIGIAYNKCSNYCSALESYNLLSKKKRGKEVFVKSRIQLERLSEALHP